MRPDILNPLFADLTGLKGVGPKVALKIERVAGPAPIDLCWLLPTGIVDRTYKPTVADARSGEICTIQVTVDKHQEPPTRRLPYKVRAFDGTGFLTLVFFHGNKDYLKRTLPEGEERLISGKVERFNNEIQMVHPDFIADPEKENELPSFERIYPLTEGLSLKTLRSAIDQTLGLIPTLPEWHDPHLMAQQRWPDFKTALLSVHAPEHQTDLSPETPTRQRLAYDEILAQQLALSIVRQKMTTPRGRALAPRTDLLNKFLRELPFPLTGDQRKAIDEIKANLAQDNRMIRLLQGDVGAGKTVVALAAIITAIDAGVQTAFMSPTEILAQQHLKTAIDLLGPLDIGIGYLSGRATAAQRRQVHEDLRTGKIQLLIGTHALFQDDVVFHDLGLAVIDEQHRFGVHQRMILSEKGRHADMLVMTATPIPRTLALTLYGDMDVTILKEKPKGRKDIITRALPLERIDDTVAHLARSLREGHAAFWVCPLVDESEVLDITAATERFDHLNTIFPDKVGLVHGRLSADEKDKALKDFIDGNTKILVATTVIEVGVDIPHANIMVIEQAERFGLAQLHQLRGRVGRGRDQGSCLLLYQGPLGETAKARLNILRQTNDGFLIAEEDLRLRGVGDLLGTRQSGVPLFRLADLDAHRDYLAMAHDDARLILDKDPDLENDRGHALRNLLYLFRQDEKIRMLRSG